MQTKYLTMKKLIAILAILLAFVSCIKDEPRNSECDILSAEVDESLAEHFHNASQMKISGIASNERKIVFVVRSTASLPAAVKVSFTLTEGATIVPESGSAQDFTHGPVKYTVTSEDGKWHREYEVLFKDPSLVLDKLGFEHFEEETSQIQSTTRYHVFYEMDDSDSPRNIWASGNAGVAMMNSEWTPEKFPTYATSEGYKGYGLCLNTQSAGSLGALFGKPIAAGNLFIGRFILDKVMSNPLETTDFGTPVIKEPASVSGWYKYAPGPVFTNKDNKVVEGRTDEANIYGVFWRNTDEEGNEVKLDGSNVFTSPYIIRKAQVESLPATDSWTRFEMNFDGERADAGILAGLGYSFTLVFSSSKGGDAFEGAVGSTLYVDEVEIKYMEDQP